MWRCEFCGVENEIGSDVLTVHHLDGNKWNLSPWNLAIRCHREVQWTIDFYQGIVRCMCAFAYDGIT